MQKILRTPILKSHWLKSVSIRSYSGAHFLAFGLNTERYEVSLPIQPECGKCGRKYLRIRHFLFREHHWWLFLPLAKWNREECFKVFWSSKIHIQNWKCRSSHQRYSVKKGALRNFWKFTRTHLCQSLFFNKVAGLLQLY